jgi:hypothetical protein
VRLGRSISGDLERRIEPWLKRHHQIKYRKEVAARHEDWQRSVNNGAPGESKAQQLKQIDAADKIPEALKTFKKACDRAAY